MNIFNRITSSLQNFWSNFYDATHNEDPTKTLQYKAVNNISNPIQSVFSNIQQWGKQLSDIAMQHSANVVDKWYNQGYIDLWSMIKAKHPQYSDISDEELGRKIVAKYPQYQDIVTKWSGISSNPISWSLASIESGLSKWVWTLFGGISDIGSAPLQDTWTAGVTRFTKGVLETGLWAAQTATSIMPTATWVKALIAPTVNTLFSTDTAGKVINPITEWIGTGIWMWQQALWLNKDSSVSKDIQNIGSTLGTMALFTWSQKWASKAYDIASPYVKQGAIQTGKAIVSWVSNIPEWVSKIWNYVIQVPKKIVRWWVDVLERIKPWAKDMLVNLDPQSKYAVERSTPKEISKIIEDAKNAKIDPRADYQQTPYHKGAEMANKTVDIISENLKKRQSERMAILENVPMEKVDLNYSRNKLKSELDKLNIENITIDEAWKPVIVPKKWRSALLDQNNPQDMQAIQKLWEILRDDVSPLQTMDNIKILQEWLYENKWTIALKGISKKMEWIVSNIQSSLNKTFKDQLPPEYRKVMDSMSEDMQMSHDIKKLFWIWDDGMPVWNKWELIMKRLTNWTTTWGEARILAEKILKKYWIDLIKEARLRQLSMELVWDTRWANLFWAVLSGRKWMMDWAMWKIGDTMIDKESLINSYAWTWKIVKPKKQQNLYTKPKKNVWDSNNSNTPINTEWSKKVNTPLNFKSSNNYK